MPNIFGSLSSFASSLSSNTSNLFSKATSSLSNLLPSSFGGGGITSGITGLVSTQASKVLGQTMGGYSSYGFSLNQGIVNSFYSAAVNNGIPLIYASLFGIDPGNSGGLPIDAGFTQDATSLDERHIISVFSKAQNIRVRCPIQEQIEVRTGSNWEPLVPSNLSSILHKFEPLAQMMGTSTYQKFFQRRIWAGSKPLTLKLPMKFVAVKDAYADVVLPVKALMKMALPRIKAQALKDFMRTVTEVTSKAGVTINPVTLLSPPGPSSTPEVDPFGVALNEQMNIYFGRIAWFHNVIISDVQTTFDSRVDSSGKPISAKVDITFETFEMFTGDDIDETFACTSTSSEVSA